MATTTATRGAASRAGKTPMKASAAAFEVDGDDKTTSALLMPGSKAAPTNGRTAGNLLDRYSHPLVLPSDTAFRVLLIAPLVVWWVAVLAGAWVYEGLPKGQRVYHAMLWFDKGVLRPAGSLVPFVVVAVRGLVHVVDHHWRLRRGGSTAAAARKQQQVGLRLGSLLLNCLTIYSAMAVARLVIYMTHYFLLAHRYLEFHIVSDHIFLAATMLISLHTEVVCLMSDLLRVEHRLEAADRDPSGSSGSSRRDSLCDAFLALLLVLALLLYLCTAADMFYTGKYYHFPMESVATTVLVFIMFQCPMLVWMISRRQRVASRHTH